MRTIRGASFVHTLAAAGLIASGVGCEDHRGTTGLADSLMAVAAMNPSLIAEGREIFRFDTFGNEWFWTGTLALHTKIQALAPQDAIAAGLKIDIDAPALPAAVRQQLIAGTADLTDPNVTVALIGFDAVLGVKGEVENGTLVKIGITCALCHSTVDGPVAGHRLDGWPNRDLNVGAIIALSDALDAPYNTWGPGMYDPRFNFNTDKPSEPVVLPPAFGLRHVKKETYTGDGEVSYWNAYVGITQMRGQGVFIDPRINVNVDNRMDGADLVSGKLPALLAYQLSLDTPQPQSGTYDAAAAARGKIVFKTTAGCARCHLGAIYSDINANKLHSADEVGQDGEYATRSVTKMYRTTPLRGLWNPPHLDGPYFHNGSATTLEQVVQHYVLKFGLSLTDLQKSDLVEYLKTL